MQPFRPSSSQPICKADAKRIHSAFRNVHQRTFRRPQYARNASTAHTRQRPRRFGRNALLIVTFSAVTGFLLRAFFKPNHAPTWDQSSFLDPHRFRSFTLIGKESISSTSSIFRIRPANGSLDAKRLQELWDRGIWSVQVKQPQLQIVRAYTPLPPDTEAINGQDDDTVNELRLLIRREEGGEVSGYLHRLPIGSEIEVRRANIEFQLPPDATEILFLAGGTGIVPAMQLAFASLRRSHTRTHILWANRRREDCVGGISPSTSLTKPYTQSWLRKTLGAPSTGERESSVSNTTQPSSIVRQFQHYERQKISVEYFVDEEHSFIKPEQVAERLKPEAVNHVNNPQPSRFILVSGPDGFVAYWAGKKPMEGGEDSQGPVGGVLSRLDLGEWKVYKL